MKATKCLCLLWNIANVTDQALSLNLSRPSTHPALKQPVRPRGFPPMCQQTLGMKSFLSEAENNSEQNVLVKQPFYFMPKISQVFKVKSHLK